MDAATLAARNSSVPPPLWIASPEAGHMSDLEAVPNPVIHSCQILDPGRDVRRFEAVSPTC